MPHQCVRCGKLYEDGAEEILKGCYCGARLFYYVSKDKLEAAQRIDRELSKQEKEEIEKEVYEIIEHRTKQRVDDVVILDFEAIRVLEPGKFELDLVHLFKKDPLVFKIGEGKYVIDLPSVFEKTRKKKKR